MVVLMKMSRFLLLAATIVAAMAIFLAIVQANAWVVEDFFKIVDPKWYHILGAIGVGMLDVCVFVFGVVESSQIKSP